MRKWQIHLLTVANCVFYAFNMPSLLFLLMFSMLSNSIISYRMDHTENKKPLLVFGVIMNVLLLSHYKYTPFLVETFFPESIIQSSSLLTGATSLIFPVGISFYTFQGISLLVSTYKGQNKDLQKTSFWVHFIDTCFYISFFPQLVAGPIERAQTFIPQIKEKFFKEIDWEGAIQTLILGYFLKTVIADSLSSLTAPLNTDVVYVRSSWNLIILSLSYGFQMFADFAGYSIIAMGLARLFGYQLTVNFNYPLIAESMTEFWKRWHITLSNWFREYLYIPLGGNRKGIPRWYFNLFFVTLVSGIWHGNTLNFLLWGIMHGVVLITELYLGRKFSYRPPSLLRIIWIVAFFNVTILLYLVKDLSQMQILIENIMNNWNYADNARSRIATYTSVLVLPIIIMHVHAYLVKYEYQIYVKHLKTLKPIYLAIMLVAILLARGPEAEFIYFQF